MYRPSKWMVKKVDWRHWKWTNKSEWTDQTTKEVDQWFNRKTEVGPSLEMGPLLKMGPTTEMRCQQWTDDRSRISEWNSEVKSLLFEWENDRRIMIGCCLVKAWGFVGYCTGSSALVLKPETLVAAHQTPFCKEFITSTHYRKGLAVLVVIITQQPNVIFSWWKWAWLWNPINDRFVTANPISTQRNFAPNCRKLLSCLPPLPRAPLPNLGR